MASRKWVFLYLLITSSLMASEYPILFHRPTKVGDQHHASIKVKEENRLIMMVGKNPMQTQDERYDLTLQADVKVLEVTNGTESRIRIQITDIDCLKNNAKDNTIKINTIVIAERHKDQTVFKTPEGVLLSEEAQKLYRMAFTVSDGEHSDDKAFGTTAKKRVGDQWPVNASFAAADLKTTGFVVKPEDVSGQVKLEEVVKDQGNDCLRISVLMDIRNVQNFPLPDYLKPTKTLFTCQASGLFPTDLSKSAQQSSETYSFDILAHGKVTSDSGEQEISLIGRVVHQAETTITPMSGK